MIRERREPQKIGTKLVLIFAIAIAFIEFFNISRGGLWGSILYIQDLWLIDELKEDFGNTVASVVVGIFILLTVIILPPLIVLKSNIAHRLVDNWGIKLLYRAVIIYVLFFLCPRPVKIGLEKFFMIDIGFFLPPIICISLLKIFLSLSGGVEEKNNATLFNKVIITLGLAQVFLLPLFSGLSRVNYFLRNHNISEYYLMAGCIIVAYIFVQENRVFERLTRKGMKLFTVTTVYFYVKALIETKLIYMTLLNTLLELSESLEESQSALDLLLSLFCILLADLQGSYFAFFVRILFVVAFFKVCLNLKPLKKL